LRRSIGPIRAFVSGLLSLSILGLGGYGAYEIAGRRWLTQETYLLQAHFGDVGGLEAGSKVRVQGIEAGVVQVIVPPTRPGEPVAVVLKLDASMRPLIRSDARGRVAQQGVVGAKIIEIDLGRADAPPIPADGVLPTDDPVDLADLLAQARASLARLDAVASSAELGMAELTAIAGKVRSGQGTLGRLVHDDEAYDRLVSLTDRGEETLTDLNENLDALKHTWPISRYFNNREFFDRDRVLYRPEAARASRSLAAADLFEEGRAILTPRGRQLLDDTAPWFKSTVSKNSEVVIASFTDRPAEPDLANVLTQERAEAVKRYLVAKQSLNSVGWFRSRRIAAIGFGTQPPRGATIPLSPQAPASRIELIVFTPQA
jgi:phospholipid/cholesterol/gamma-HCH transport system substrate-binding protein